MELVTVVGVTNTADQFLETMENPLIHFLHVFIVHGVPMNVKSVQVAQNVTTRIADTPVGVHQALEYFV